MFTQEFFKVSELSRINNTQVFGYLVQAVRLYLHTDSVTDLIEGTVQPGRDLWRLTWQRWKVSVPMNPVRWCSISFLGLLPQHGQLKTIEIYSLTVLEIRNQAEISFTASKSRCWQGHDPSGRLYRRISSLPLPGAGGCWHSLACGPNIPSSPLGSHWLLLLCLKSPLAQLPL